MAERFVIPSRTSIDESSRLEQLTESQVADDYLRYPPLPYDTEIVIDKLGIMNLNLVTRRPLGMLRYGALRMKRPDLFPECKDPKMEYEDEEQVSPVVVISGDTKYRTDQLLWFPLADALTGITFHQAKTKKKLLPIKVFLDRKNQWIVPLLNLSKGLV